MSEESKAKTRAAFQDMRDLEEIGRAFVEAIGGDLRKMRNANPPTVCAQCDAHYWYDAECPKCGTPAIVSNAARNADAASRRASALQQAAVADMKMAATRHQKMTGKHTHPHAAFGADDSDDGFHSHEHEHHNDSVHVHHHRSQP